MRETGRCECSFGFRGDACDDIADSDDAQVRHFGKIRWGLPSYGGDLLFLDPPYLLLYLVLNGLHIKGKRVLYLWPFAREVSRGGKRVCDTADIASAGKWSFAL